MVIWLAVPAGPDERARRSRFDLPGAVLLGTGLATLLLVVSEGAVWGWTSIPTIITAIVSIAALVGWRAVEIRATDPLINLRVIRSPDVVLANFTAIGLGAALYMGLSIISLIAQAPRTTGYGIALPLFWAGFVMLPLSFGSLGANRAVRLLSRRISLLALLPFGAGLMTAATLLLWIAHDRLWELLMGMLLFGIGMGTAYAAMPALIEKIVAVHELGSAVSFNQVLRTAGGAVGSAVAGAVFASHLNEQLRPTDAGISQALLIALITSAVVLFALTIHHLWRSRN